MLLIAAYAALVGASASVVRAAIMGIGYLIGRRFLGRPTLVVATLLATGFLMTLAEPTALWDIGFQLSLAATLGLLLYAEPWLRRLDRATGGMPDATQPVTRQLLGEAFIVTMSAQVLTLPLLLFHFGRL